MTFKTTCAAIGAAAFLAIATGPAQAIPLAPGGVIFPGGTTVAADPNLAGVVINDNLLPFTIDPTPATPFTNTGGNVQNRVVVSNNLGTLIFGPRIRDTFNIDGGTLAIVGMRLTGYGMFSTDVDFRTDGLGDKGFTSVSRSNDGDTMTFRYDDPLLVDSLAPPAGLGRQQESLFPSILTDAPNYKLTGTATIFAQLTVNDDPFGDVFSVTIDGLAVPDVPVPASMLLMLGALGTLGVARARRRKRS